MVFKDPVCHTSMDFTDFVGIYTFEIPISLITVLLSSNSY